MRKRGLILATAVLLFPAASHAQDGFMFGQPKGQLTLRAGPVLHRAGGDLLNFFQSELTLDRGDFRAPAIGGEIAFVVHPSLDIAVGAGWSNVESGSESRHYWEDIDGEDVPIRQTTALRVIPVTATLRYYPLSRGQSISQFAWVPARTTPYLGVGGGMAWHRLQQWGDFVQESDLTIFTDSWESNSRSGIAHVLAGVDHWFSPRFGLNAEGRYTFGSATPAGDFASWDSIDLSGLQLGVGLAVRW